MRPFRRRRWRTTARCCGGRDRFPALDLEIGDSWIHGVASDPAKTARFLALQRLYDEFSETALTSARKAFGRGLTMVAEHTWGVDIKTFLRDETAWDRHAFEAARKSDYRFQYSEQSWAEQRAYLDTAVAALDGDDRARAERALPALPPALPATGARAQEGPLSVGEWQVTVDPETGDIASLRSPAGVMLVGLAARCSAFRHESYDSADVRAQMDSYILHREDWAILDHDKPGLDTAATARSGVWRPALSGMQADGKAVAVSAAFAGAATEALGAPTRIEFRLAASGPETLEIALVLRGKPANRMA